MKHGFKIGDLVQLRGRWAERDDRQWDELPKGVVAGFGNDNYVPWNGVHVYWFDECRVYKDEDPEALKLLSES